MQTIHLFISQMGVVALPLIVFSLIALTLIIERSYFYLRLPAGAQSQTLAALMKTLTANKSKSKLVRDELVTHLLVEKKDPYFFGIRILRLIAVTAPMVGLLGTVIGLIRAFKVISLHQGPVYPALIADGIWTAMVTTVAGLVIALPCLFAAFIFTRMAEKRVQAYQVVLNAKSLEFEGVALHD